MAQLPEPARLLVAACERAYDAFTNDCSHAVHQVIREIVDPQFPYRVANDLMAYFASPGSGWRQVSSVEEASSLADQGIVVVGGLAYPRGQGHVLVVMPGPMHDSGGFVYNGNRIRSHGRFPPALSTSSSGYIGALSRGEKTVFDPWTPADWPRVTFWTRTQ